MPYTVIGIALVLLAVLIGTSKLPKIETAAPRLETNGRRFRSGSIPIFSSARSGFLPTSGRKSRSEVFW